MNSWRVGGKYHNTGAGSINIVMNNDTSLAVAARACAWRLARQFTEEISYPVENARRRFRRPVVGGSWRRRCNLNRDRLSGCGVYMTAKLDGRAQTHFAHKQNGFGVGRSRGSGFGGTLRSIGVKTKRRHENGIDGLLRGSGWCRGIWNWLGLRGQRGSARADVQSRLGTRRRGGGGLGEIPGGPGES